MINPAAGKRAATITCAAALLLVALVLNSRVLNCYFVNDDFVIISRSYDKGPLFFAKLFFTDWMKVFYPGFDFGSGFIRPMMILSIKLEYLLYGVNPLPYHLTNLMVHFFNGLLLFLITDFVTSRKAAALTASIMFLAHPVNTCVGWLSSRDNLMATFLMLLGFYFFMLYRSKGAKSYHAWSVVAFLFGVYTREDAVVLPLMLITYDVIRELADRPRPLLSNRLINMYKAYIPYWVILAIYFTVRKLGLGSFIGGYSWVGLTLNDKLVNNINYARLAVGAPVWDLSLIYRSTTQLAPVNKVEFLLVSFLSVVLLLALLWEGVKQLEHRRLFILSLLCGGASYLPILAISLVMSEIFPLYLYAVIPWVSCALAALLFSLHKERTGVVISILLITFYAVHQFKSNLDWEHAGSITKRFVQAMQTETKKFQKGATIVLIDVPITYKTAWVFAESLEGALHRPFTDSDIIDDFNIKTLYLFSVQKS